MNLLAKDIRRASVRAIRSAALAVLLASAASASAQTLTLKQCLDLAAGHSLELKAADAQVERARIMQGTAWDVEQTQLSLSQDPTSGGSPDNALSLSQTIEFPTVYAARRAELKAATRAEQGRRNLVAVQLRADIASAYHQLVYEMELRRILLSQDSLLRRYADVAQKRCEAGEARRLESLSAGRMLRENAMELASADARIEAARLRLQALVGSAEAVTPADTTLMPVPYTVDAAYNYAATAEGEYDSRRIDVAGKALRVARGGYAPSLSLALKNQLVITGWDPYHENRSRYGGGNFMGFEVGIGIPLFFGATKAKVRAARKDRDIALIEMQSRRQQREREHDAALARYNAALSRLRYYDAEGMSTAAETARLSALEYENGEISYVEYVSALQQSADTRMKRAAAVNDYNQAVVQLRRMAE